MPEHTSWLSFIPGWEGFEHAIQSLGTSWMDHNPVHVQHVGSMILVCLALLLVSVRARSQLAKAGNDILPEDKLTTRNVVEMIMAAVLAVMAFAMPPKAALRHFWLIGTLAFFILFSNLLGLIPGFVPPTESLNTTFACGSIVFLYYNGYAFYRLGLGHLAHLANPTGESWGWFLSWLFLPLEVVSHCVRPISLSMRLLCNIAGDHMVMGVILGMVPLIIPVPLLFLGLLVAVLQTVVFTLLSSVYIGEVEAMVEHHLAAHGSHGGHGASHETAAHAAH